MEFSTTDRIDHPLDLVFRSHRDHLTELVEYLPSVESIDVESREEESEVVRLVNIWTAAKTEVPRVIRPFIKPHMLKWVDTAAWYASDHLCRWKIELGFLKEAICFEGQNQMRPTDDGATEVTISGTVRIDAAKVPGVPKFMAKRIGNAVEAFVIKMITPNLQQTNEGVAYYIERQQQPPVDPS